MDKIRDQLKNPIVVGVAGLILGLILGLLYAWQINPVEWTDANPAALSADWQEEYLRMAIHSFGATGDAAAAQRQYKGLGEAADATLARVIETPQGLNPELVASYATIATGAAVSPMVPPEAETGAYPEPETGVQPGEEPGVGAEPESGVLPEAEPEKESGRSSLVTTLIGAICLVLLLIAGAIGYMLFRGRFTRSGTSAPTPAQAANEARRQTSLTDYAATGSEPPVAQFMASFKLGDDLFDDSFSIDSPTGEFLGECGVGISETVGVGEPKKVTAFEVWLFDKNDIQTVTKVVMSLHAFFDGSIRQRLEAKGEPIQAEPNTEIVLETQSLEMVARVVDMGYGEGAMPPQSYFDHLLLELAVWQK